LDYNSWPYSYGAEAHTSILKYFRANFIISKEQLTRETHQLQQIQVLEWKSNQS
jgi:hypothetical protein